LIEQARFGIRPRALVLQPITALGKRRAGWTAVDEIEFTSWDSRCVKQLVTRDGCHVFEDGVARQLRKKSRRVGLHSQTRHAVRLHSSARGEPSFFAAEIEAAGPSEK